MTQYWLGLDCGGSWLKAGLYDREGREAGVQRLPLCALSPQPGWAERDMAELWQCCIAVIRPLLTHSGVSGLRIELPQVEETGCFGAALAARVGTGVYRDFSEAQRDLQHPVRTLLPDMTAHQLYQQKYQRYQHLIAALQGFHARIKEHTL
ncbi:TPA: hypothetical protein KCG98_002701 [Escherichia coli]|nr:hypothetical protein [Escherichia coli]